MKNTHFTVALIAIAFTFLPGSLIAQKIYLTIGSGYGIGMGSLAANEYTYEQKSSGNVLESTKFVDLTLGKGINIGGSVGYVFNKNIGVELGASYLIGGSTSFSHSYSYPTYTDDFSYKVSSNMFKINPALVISAGFEVLNPYLKLGLIVGKGSMNTEIGRTYKSLNYNASIILHEIVKDKGGFAIGYNTAIGLSYNMGDHFAVFGELNMVNLSYTPTKGEIVSYTIDGEDKLSELKTNEKEYEYVDSYTYNSSVNESTSTPSKQLKNRLSFGSIGLNLGVRITF